jgi:uncharacterized protein YlxP (DUF503 family)
MVTKSICGKVSSKFNVAIAEVDALDMHQSIVIGIACVTNEMAHCNSILDNVLEFVDGNTEEEFVKFVRN